MSRKEIIFTLCFLFVTEMVVWWQLNFSYWALVCAFVASVRGHFLLRLRQTKKEPELST